MPLVITNAPGSARGGLQGTFTVRLTGVAELNALFQKAERLGNTEIKRALRPASRIAMESVRQEAPKGDSGKLRRSVRIKAIRNQPILIVTVAREKALSVSKAYPTGYPYVNYIISENRGRDQDQFLIRGFVEVEPEVRRAAIIGLTEMLKQARFF